MLAIATQLKLQEFQLDVKSALLNGELQEEAYVKQPQWYVIKGQEGMVYKLKTTLYDLKQTPTTWNRKIDNYLKMNRFQRSLNESSLYIKRNEVTTFSCFAYILMIWFMLAIVTRRWLIWKIPWWMTMRWAIWALKIFYYYSNEAKERCHYHFSGSVIPHFGLDTDWIK